MPPPHCFKCGRPVRIGRIPLLIQTTAINSALWEKMTIRLLRGDPMTSIPVESFEIQAERALRSLICVAFAIFVFIATMMLAGFAGWLPFLLLGAIYAIPLMVARSHPHRNRTAIT